MTRIVNIGFRALYVLGVGAWVIDRTSNPAEVTVIWKDLAYVALSCISVLLMMGYKDFSKRLDSANNGHETNTERLDDLKDHLNGKLEVIERKLTRMETTLKLDAGGE